MHINRFLFLSLFPSLSTGKCQSGRCQWLPERPVKKAEKFGRLHWQTWSAKLATGDVLLFAENGLAQTLNRMLGVTFTHVGVAYIDPFYEWPLVYHALPGGMQFNSLVCHASRNVIRVGP
jgi:hypothetical protein